MPALTRRPDPNASQEAWPIYYGDVCAGGIAVRTGTPDSSDPWYWRCGFYPGSNPGECTTGTATTFEQAPRGPFADPCNRQPHLLTTLPDTRTGKTVRIFRCPQGGEITSAEERC
ncbi:hypothetical protein FXV83_41820 [Bradyrhizobium hipponense]|uniref:Uncharacterized protein n=1 Tax=Bradyrhizobium hipponense TaxID=2605638 RepID=A0A5S4Y8M1_9BRAD|nr:hypothetical protein [Bradyrhizobium hipponense]TYO60801.1 hypothetical protein FXV83_41820 [Bradyrhizobium hipponense]